MTTKAKRPRSAYRLVLVEWEDSVRPVAEWQWVDDYAVPAVVLCASVGYLIADTKAAIALAPNLGTICEAGVQACGIIRIPRSAIVRMRTL